MRINTLYESFRKRSFLSAVLMFLIMFGSMLTFAPPNSIFSASSSSVGEYVANEAIVGFYGPQAFQQNHPSQIAAKYGITLKDTDSYLSAALFDNVSNATLASLQSDDLVKYAERNFVGNVSEIIPDDPLWPSQWGPISINAPNAWEIVNGSSTFKVAVVDTGIDYTHPDIAANYLPGGYDWRNNDPDPMDENGHGTKVAGILGAVGNNGIGIAGMAWTIKIIAEKVFDASGYGTAWQAAKGITHAVTMGAKIINLSFAFSPSDYSLKNLHQAVQFAYNQGILLVAGSGNQGSTIWYPARYPEVVAVSAINQSDMRLPNSNYGQELELVAPGMDIRTLNRTGNYTWTSATSAATPFVSGVAALMWIRNPSLTRDELRSFLGATATDLGIQGWDELYGWGKVNAYEGVIRSQFRYNITVSPANRTITPNGSVSFTISVSLLQGPSRIISLGLDDMYPLNPGLTTTWSSSFGFPPFTSTLTIAANATPTKAVTVHRVRGLSYVSGLGVTRYSNFFKLNASAPFSDFVWIRTSETDTGSVPRSGAYWTSPDIWSNPNPPVLGQNNTLYIKVRNKGGSNTGPVRVQVWYTNWSIIQNVPVMPTLGIVNISDIAPYAETVVSFNWFLPSFYSSHVCVFAQAWRPGFEGFTSQFDFINNNNLAQKNMDAVYSHSPYITSFNIENPLNETMEARLYATAPAGWIVDFEIPSVSTGSGVVAPLMIPPLGSKEINFTVIPPDSAPPSGWNEVNLWGNTTNLSELYGTEGGAGGFTFNVNPVGGKAATIDKLTLLAPYAKLASIVIIATIAVAIYVKRQKRKSIK